MSYCLNPDCHKPQNPNATKFCQSCGTKLVLAERYRAIKLIGTGGFGRTLLAEDEYKPSKPDCVIKQFYPQGQNNAGKAAELFQQEAVRLEQLGKHSQIPELFAHFEQDSRQYIVQEFIDGQNLAEELAETGVFGEKQICSLLGDLLPVLQFIHEGQVIHRDIKPENIIRRRSDGRLVLVDFGAAKYATGTALGKTGTTIGSAGHAAPEQTFGQAVFASDIYSFGVTCIHLLTDIEPFNLYDAVESAFVWRHHLSNSPVSDQLGRILDKMTHSVTKQRYKTAEEVIKALEFSGGTQRSTQKQTDTGRLNYENIGLIATFSGSKSPIYSVAISPDGSKVASGSGVVSPLYFFDKDNTVKVWNIDSEKLIYTLTGHSRSVGFVAFSPDGRTIASGSNDYTIKLWDVSTGQEKYTLKAHSGWIYSIAFSPDGQTLASGSQDKTIKLWNVCTGQEKRILRGHSSKVYSVAFSPDGQILASGSGDKTIRLWDVATGQHKQTLGSWFSGHSNCVYSVAFSPDGGTLASGSADNTIKLWDVSTGKEIQTLKSHLSSIYSIAFSPDGNALASGSADATIKLWDCSTFAQLCNLREHSVGVSSVTFSLDGQTLASSSLDKTIKIWRVTR